MTKYTNPLPYRKHEGGDAMLWGDEDLLEVRDNCEPPELYRGQHCTWNADFKWRHAMDENGWIKWDGRDDKTLLDGVHFERKYQSGLIEDDSAVGIGWVDLKFIRVPVVEEAETITPKQLAESLKTQDWELAEEHNEAFRKMEVMKNFLDGGKEAEPVKDNPKHSIPTRAAHERDRRLDLLQALMEYELIGGSEIDRDDWVQEFVELSGGEA